MGLESGWPWIVIALAAYLLGSLPVGYVTAKRKGGIDIRRHGSGNVGATNVTRVLGVRAGAIVLAGDVAKGALAAWLGMRLGGVNGAVLAGVLAVVGHAWPVFLRFSGGKSVATALGAVVVVSGWVAGALILTWGLVVLATRYVSLASMVSASSAPVWLWLAYHDHAVLVGGLVMTVVVILRHRSNVRRLVQGAEHRAY
ncbi:MAG: glycerol-3-phosphate 1-O-acyltransferase PlsY [Limnochordaceae bacterium]|nr:glycerol-3-phosphate 1-O-acyltransferase PlsY [Limnochordaceae bacterium]